MQQGDRRRVLTARLLCEKDLLRASDQIEGRGDAVVPVGCDKRTAKTLCMDHTLQAAAPSLLMWFKSLLPLTSRTFAHQPHHTTVTLDVFALCQLVTTIDYTRLPQYAYSSGGVFSLASAARVPLYEPLRYMSIFDRGTHRTTVYFRLHRFSRCSGTAYGCRRRGGGSGAGPRYAAPP